MRNYRHINIIQSCSNYQPKILLKYYSNINKLYLYQNLPFSIYSTSLTSRLLFNARHLFLLLSVCTDNLKSAPFIIIFLSNRLLYDNDKLPRGSNPAQ